MAVTIVVAVEAVGSSVVTVVSIKVIVDVDATEAEVASDVIDAVSSDVRVVKMIP